MNDINHLTIIGRVTHDLTEKDYAYTSGGSARLNLSIAVNESYKADGQWTDYVNYFDVVIWGKTAENLKPYMSKGKQIAVEGRLQQQRWKTNDGTNRSKIVIVADNIQLLGGRNDGGNIAQPQQAAQNYASGDFPEDIPF